MRKLKRAKLIRVFQRFLAVCILTGVFLAAGNPLPAQALIPASHSQEQEEADFIYASLSTRTHLITVPAVLTLDVVSTGGSGLYSYQWSVIYLNNEKNVSSSGETGQDDNIDKEELEEENTEKKGVTPEDTVEELSEKDGAQAMSEVDVIQEEPEVDVIQEEPEVDVIQEESEVDVIQEESEVDVIQEESEVDASQETSESSSVPEPEYSPHKEISIYKTGTFIVRVTVTDRRTGNVTTAVTDAIEAVDRTQWQYDPSAIQDETDQYFRCLMPYLRRGEDPMQDETFTDLLEQRFREQNFTDTQISGTINILKHADPLYRDLYLLSFYEYTMFGMQETGSGYINPPNAAFVSAASSATSFSGTYFHEAGHGIHMSQWNLDEHPIQEIILTEGWQEAAAPAGNTDLEAQIMDAIQMDVRNRILEKLSELAEQEGDVLTAGQMNQIADALVNGDAEVSETVWWWTEEVHPSLKDDKLLRKYYIAVRDDLSSELSEIPYSNSNMVGDLYGGITNHKLVLPYGHAGNYWYTQDGQANGMQLCEGWAEFFSAMVRKDSYYKKINQEYLPETVAAMERLAERLREQYMERYSALYPEDEAQPEYEG